MAGDQGLTNVYLPDSWVLGIETDESHVCFTVEAALEEDHPLYYFPPKPGEAHAYAVVRWCITGEVWWNEGPLLDRPSVGPDNEVDYGSFDAWFSPGDVDHLEGEWGAVAIRGAKHHVTLIEP